MNLLTLGQVRERLWTYTNAQVSYASASATQLADATFRINQVCERFLTEGKWKYSLRRITLPIEDGYITLPRNFETILGIQLQTASLCCAVSQVYTRFHEFAHGYTGCCSTGTYPISETAASFLTPTAPFTLRVKSTVSEAKTITFYGGYDTNDDEFFGGDTVTIINGTANGTRTYNSMPPTGGIQKEVTTVPVELYSVTDGVETLIAVYGPYETVPAYKKYKVPDFNSTFTTAIVLGKLAFIEAVNTYDIIVPSHWGALKLGLKALRSEDTEEDDMADQDWQRAYNLLNNQVTEAEGDNEFPIMKFQAGFGCDGVMTLV
jgi:hypothetical protein